MNRPKAFSMKSNAGVNYKDCLYLKIQNKAQITIIIQNTTMINFMNTKNTIHDYTEAEFLEFLKEFFENKYNLKGKEYGRHINLLVTHFDKLVNHPNGSDLIFYPSDQREDNPEGILEEIKRWRQSQGLPLFKSFLMTPLHDTLIKPVNAFYAGISLSPEIRRNVPYPWTPRAP